MCQRYIKAFDARQASRPVLPVVDAVATLPLDAAAMQKGYRNGTRDARRSRLTRQRYRRADRAATAAALSFA